MLLFSTTNNLIYLSCHSHNFHVFAIAKKDNNLICFIVQLLLCASISTGIVYLTDTREINMISIKILRTRNYDNFHEWKLQALGDNDDEGGRGPGSPGDPSQPVAGSREGETERGRKVPPLTSACVHCASILRKFG